MPTDPPPERLPDGAVRVPLTPGAFALIDAADADAVLRYSWHLHPAGYAARSRRAEDGPGPRMIYMHRSLLNAPARMPVRHRPGFSRLDNRRATLQLARPSQSRAGHDLRRDNASGYRGVTWAKRGRWQAQIQVDGTRRFLGYFTEKDDAARAYDTAAVEAFGDFAQRNLPPEESTT
jgi:hypothetical protein